MASPGATMEICASKGEYGVFVLIECRYENVVPMVADVEFMRYKAS